MSLNISHVGGSPGYASAFRKVLWKIHEVMKFFWISCSLIFFFSLYFFVSLPYFFLLAGKNFNEKQFSYQEKNFEMQRQHFWFKKNPGKLHILNHACARVFSHTFLASNACFFLLQKGAKTRMCFIKNSHCRIINLVTHKTNESVLIALGVYLVRSLSSMYNDAYS